MIRSLGLVLGIVAVVFVLAQTPKSNEKTIRVIDPSGDVRQFSQAAPSVPVPGPLPGWRPTVSDYEGEVLRVGWVTPAGEYAEYAASSRPSPTFVKEFTGDVPQSGTVEIGGVTWTRYVDDDALSLVRTVGGATVVLGTLRDTAKLDELEVLAAGLST